MVHAESLRMTFLVDAHTKIVSAATIIVTFASETAAGIGEGPVEIGHST